MKPKFGGKDMCHRNEDDISGLGNNKQHCFGNVIQISHILWNVVLPVLYQDDDALIEDMFGFLNVCDGFFPLAKIGLRKLHTAITRKTESRMAASITIATIVTVNRHFSLVKCIESTPHLLPCMKWAEAMTSFESVCRFTTGQIPNSFVFEKILKSQQCDIIRRHRSNSESPPQKSDASQGCSVNGIGARTDLWEHIMNRSLDVFHSKHGLIYHHIDDHLRPVLTYTTNGNYLGMTTEDLIDFNTREEEEEKSVCIMPSDGYSKEDGIMADIFFALIEPLWNADLATSVIIICMWGKYIMQMPISCKDRLLSAAVVSESKSIFRLALATLGVRNIDNITAYSRALGTATDRNNAVFVDEILAIVPKKLQSVLRERIIDSACIADSVLVAQTVLSNTHFTTNEFTQEAWDRILRHGCSSGSLRTLKIVFSDYPHNGTGDACCYHNRQVSTLVSRHGIELAVEEAVCKRKIKVIEWILSQDGVQTQAILLDSLTWFCVHGPLDLANWFSKKYNIQINPVNLVDGNICSMTVQPIEQYDTVVTRLIVIDDPMNLFVAD